MSKENKLSNEDMQRVEQYLNSGFNATERKPFRGFRLLFGIWLITPPSQSNCQKPMRF